VVRASFGRMEMEGEWRVKERFEGEGRNSRVVVVVVLTLSSYGVVDRRYLTFCHCHDPPSFKEDREVGEDCLQLL